MPRSLWQDTGRAFERCPPLSDDRDFDSAAVDGLAGSPVATCPIVRTESSS